MKQVLQSLVDELERDRSLRVPERLRQRIEALDRLEEALIDVQDDPSVETEPQRRAKAVCSELDGINRHIYQEIRQAIQQGDGAGKLLQWLPSQVFNSEPVGNDGESYDYLDALVSGVLQFDEPGDDIAGLAPEMVFYQPTPARLAFDVIERLALDEHDVLIDLGSGLGHVPLLAAICTRARCAGVELESAYVTCARRCADALKLSNAYFFAQDAREADLSTGTVFYLYTPFTGALLRGVLDRLAREAATRHIRICTLGPCTQAVAGEAWLQSIGTSYADRVAVFQSR
jgi:tRNA/tmRNA/rRNA uracil-C5-methylase (TrmA/RlmC/RlmD family)